MKRLGFFNDTYRVDSIKNMTRQKRGTSSTILALQVLNRICHKVTTGKSFWITVNIKTSWSKWRNSMYWSLVPEFYQDLLLLLYQEKNNILLCPQEIML